MKVQTYVSLVFATSLILLLVSTRHTLQPVSALDGTHRPLTKWEYKMVRVEPKSLNVLDGFNGDLNKLGADGWEVALLVREQIEPLGDNNHVLMIFKRPKR